MMTVIVELNIKKTSYPKNPDNFFIQLDSEYDDFEDLETGEKFAGGKKRKLSESEDEDSDEAQEEDSDTNNNEKKEEEESNLTV